MALKIFTGAKPILKAHIKLFDITESRMHALWEQTLTKKRFSIKGIFVLYE
jgi:hypothetical protein